MRLLSDAPLDDAALDELGFSDFARALTEILDNESTDTPLTVAVSAPWGAGKTSVACMVQQLLERRVAERDGDRERVVCWFNAWNHNDAPHLGAALAAVVAREASRRRSLWRRLLQPLPSAMLDHQARSRRLVLGGIASLVAAIILVVRPETQGLATAAVGVEQTGLAPLGGLGVLLVVWVVWRRVFAAAKDAARFVDDPSSAAAHGSIAQVKEQLGRLIRHATRGGRIVIIVDDLERCHPARALEVFQVASQLLGHQGVATLLLADLRTIEHAAEKAHAGADTGTGGVGRRYLEKLLQLEVVLPPPRPDDMQRLLRGARRGANPEADGAGGAPRSRRVRSSLPPLTLTFYERVGIRTLVASLAVALVVFFTIVLALSEDAPDTAYGLVGLLLIVFALLWVTLVAVVTYARRRRRRRQRLDVEQRVKATLQATGRATHGVTSHDLEHSAVQAAEHGLKEHALKAAESYLTVHGPEVEQVEDYICRHPPPLPRAAKRMLNHARLLTHIAIDRRMFGGEPALQPAHLAEWISMRERWPEVADRVAAQPDEMARLERLAADGGELAQALGPTDDLADLAELLRDEPALAPVVERLIRFEPAPDAHPPAPSVTDRAPPVQSLPR